MSCHPRAPRRISSHANPDSRSPRDQPNSDPAVLDIHTLAQQVDAILGQPDPHRHRQIAWAPTEIVRAERGRTAASPPFHGARAAAPHDVDAVDRIQRANQHRGWRAGHFRHDVYETVDAVVQVDVDAAGAAIHRRIARRRTRGGVAGGIGFTDVGFDFDDDAAGANAAAVVDHHEPEQIAGDIESRPAVESSGRFQW